MRIKKGDLVIYKNEYSSLHDKIGIVIGIDKGEIPKGEGTYPTQDQRYQTFYDVLIGEEVFWISEKHLILCENDLTF